MTSDDHDTTPALLSRAQALKPLVPTDTQSIANESRLELINVYTQLLLTDLEEALDKKIEQELWNTAFKQPIGHLQAQIKDRSNSRRSEQQVILGLLVDQATGFYISLLGALCDAHSLSMPCRMALPQNLFPHQELQAASRGATQTVLHFAKRRSSNAPSNRSDHLTPRPPTRSSLEYMVQHCLVHLGDAARYWQQIDQACHYYQWAVKLGCSCGAGHPHNQLAILADSKSNTLASIFHYTQSLSCTKPFLAASTNLDQLLDRLLKDALPVMPLPPSGSSDSHDQKGARTAILAAFLQFHAIVYLKNGSSEEVARAKTVWDRFSACLPRYIHLFSLRSLLHMATIHTFVLHAHFNKKNGKMTNILLQSTCTFFHALVSSSPSKMTSLLPPILIIMLWYRSALQTTTIFTAESTIFPPFSSAIVDFLNTLYDSAEPTFRTASEIAIDSLMSLPEMSLLQGFLPLQLPSISRISIGSSSSLMPSPHTSPELSALRSSAILHCARLLAAGQPKVLLFMPQIRFPFAAVTPMSPLPNEFPAAVSSNNKTTPPSGSGHRSHNKRNVALTSIMQNKTSPPSVTAPDPVPMTTTMNSGAEKVTESPRQHGCQPGLIINADIARFIQEQSSQDVPTSIGASSGLRATAAVRHQIANLVDSNASSETSRHLYNENREQFQKDLPPRFARLQISKTTASKTSSSSASSFPSPPSLPDLTGKETERPPPSGIWSTDNDFTGDSNFYDNIVPPTPPASFFSDNLRNIDNNSSTWSMNQHVSTSQFRNTMTPPAFHQSQNRLQPIGHTIANRIPAFTTSATPTSTTSSQQGPFGMSQWAWPLEHLIKQQQQQQGHMTTKCNDMTSSRGDVERRHPQDQNNYTQHSQAPNYPHLFPPT